MGRFRFEKVQNDVGVKEMNRIKKWKKEKDLKKKI